MAITGNENPEIEKEITPHSEAKLSPRTQCGESTDHYYSAGLRLQEPEAEKRKSLVKYHYCKENVKYP